LTRSTVARTLSVHARSVEKKVSMSVGMVLGGRYQLRSSLGHGGFGTVWRAHDRTLGRDVAIKLINMDAIGAGDRDEISHRFFREARAVAGLNHPNVVTAHDYGVQDGTAYLVMELITGGSIEDEMRASPGPLGIDRAVVVGIQVCAGLAAAHAAGLVHRDLKPANVMNSKATDLVKIVDFGIARIADQSKITHTGSYLGTLRYTSPEQMSSAGVDARADLYSLGCVLYELMAGRSPFDAQTPVQWIAAHQYQVPPPLSAYVPDVPQALQQLVSRLLAKSPADRPVNADTVRAALMEIHGQLPAETRSARPSSVPPSVSPPTRPAPQPAGPYGGIGAPTGLDSGEPPWTPQPYGVPRQPGAPYTPQPYGVSPGSGGPYWPGGAMPMPVYPVALPPPPTPLVVGAWLLRASGLLAVTLAIINAITYDQVQDAWHLAYKGVVPDSANTGEGGLIVYIVLALGHVLFSLVIAQGLLRGLSASRVVAICFIGVIDIGCCVAGALPVEINQPGTSDFKGASQPAVDGANNAFGHLFPSSLTIGSAVICSIGALMLMASLILILVPSSSAFFRAWRGQVRAPMPIRLPTVR